MDSEEYPELQPEETPLDLEKVSAVDWLVVYPEQRFDLLWQANAIMRQFLGGGKLELARKTFNKVFIELFKLFLYFIHLLNMCIMFLDSSRFY